MPYKHTKFHVKSRQGAGLVSKRNTNRDKIAEKLRKTQENHGEKNAERNAKNQGKWGGNRKKNHLSVYLSHHRRDIAQTFMADSPNDALQIYKVSG